MAKDDSLTQEREFCKMWQGSNKIYDIFLAVDISKEESKQKTPFYEKIGKLGDVLGHLVFLPHKEIGIKIPKTEDNYKEIYNLLNEVIIPSTKLVIAYLGIESPDVGVMIARAVSAEKDLVYLIEQENTKSLPICEGAKIKKIIKFKNEEHAISEIENFLITHF